MTNELLRYISSHYENFMLEMHRDGSDVIINHPIYGSITIPDCDTVDEFNSTLKELLDKKDACALSYHKGMVDSLTKRAKK